MAARAEVAPLAGGRPQIIVPAGIAVNAHKVLVRVTAIDKTLDYALFDRALKPARIAQRLLLQAYDAVLPGGRPALIVFVQTFGDLVNFNPHLHVLAADGVFLPGGRVIALPRVPASLRAEGVRRDVLAFLVKGIVLSEELRTRMLAWRHGGFSAHNEVSVGAGYAEGRRKLAGYMLRAPMSLQKMTYDAATGTVIYRSKMHAGLNFRLARKPPGRG